MPHGLAIDLKYDHYFFIFFVILYPEIPETQAQNWGLLPFFGRPETLAIVARCLDGVQTPDHKRANHGVGDSIKPSFG